MSDSSTLYSYFLSTLCLICFWFQINKLVEAAEEWPPFVANARYTMEENQSLTLQLQELTEKLDKESNAKALVEEELDKERKAKALVEEEVRKAKATYKQQRDVQP